MKYRISLHGLGKWPTLVGSTPEPEASELQGSKSIRGPASIRVCLLLSAHVFHEVLRTRGPVQGLRSIFEGLMSKV